VNKIAHFRKKAGLSQVKLAELAGTSGQQVGRLELGVRKLNVEWAERFAPHLNCLAVELLFEDVEITKGSLTSVKCVGFVQAGDWREAVELPEDEQYTVNVPPDARFRDLEVFALEIRGDSMNLRYADKSLLICSRYDPVNDRLPVGKRVIVQRRSELGLIEATCKELIIDKDGKGWLKPDSNNPSHSSIRFTQSDDGEDDTQIIAVVMASYQPE
jgi:SOS-response transcriptional repressor LexA